MGLWDGNPNELFSSYTKLLSVYIPSQANKILAMRKRDELFLIKYEHVTNADTQSLVRRFSDTKKKGTKLRDSVYTREKEKKPHHTPP
jgi:hypothetical protein